MSETEINYKANVAGILRDGSGRILICERIGLRDAWQFPQGGIDAGESPEQALVRELREEIGVEERAIRIGERKGPFRYLYGSGRIKRGYHGKEQFYFLCDFEGDDSLINVQTEHPEFQDHRWIKPEQFRLAWLPEMKREVYRAVFEEFFSVKIA